MQREQLREREANSPMGRCHDQSNQSPTISSSKEIKKVNGIQIHSPPSQHHIMAPSLAHTSFVRLGFRPCNWAIPCNSSSADLKLVSCELSQVFKSVVSLHRGNFSIVPACRKITAPVLIHSEAYFEAQYLPIAVLLRHSIPAAENAGE